MHEGLRETRRWLRLRLQQLGSLILPPYCAGCDAPLPLGPVFCAGCGKLQTGATQLIATDVRVHAVGVYRAPLSSAIIRMKFEHRPDLAARLAELFPSTLLRSVRPHHVIPVPLHRARLEERGFNQSALLARALAHKTGARFSPGALERRRDTAQQSLLSRAERQANVKRAFVAPRPLRGGPITLIDDVVTTGATLGACVDALRDAGAGPIQVLVLAAA